MHIEGSVALVTGANRGLGQAFASALLAAGAARVYAAARDVAQITDNRLVPLALDITDLRAVNAAARDCGDVTLLVNNAGIMRSSPFLSAPSLDAARAEMETNYFGTLAMCRAFAPVLAKNGGGAIANMLSVVSWFTHPLNGSYGASKAAAQSLTNGLRTELKAQHTLVAGIYASFIDTDMVRTITAPKAQPADIALRALAGLARGEHEILADARSQEIRAALARDPAAFYAELERQWLQRPLP